MSDLLSASSLLLAIAAILFSLWYPEITTALKIDPGKYKEDNVADRTAVTCTILSKAFPVAIVSIGITAIFLPDAVLITTSSYKTYQKTGFSIANYDAVRTAYCFVTLLAAFLTTYMWSLTIRLLLLRSKLG
jgi:hypothetical protein